ncbi:MAG: hypothetical protein CL613_04705 [Aquimarina sp.]|nr:hypothetical protein [Aquimarina sp.]
MSKENFDAKLATLEAIPAAEVKAPTMPVDISLQEAEDLFTWAAEDQAALQAKGLDWDTHVADIPVRAGALRYAQSEWMKERFGREEASKVWKEESPKAFELRNDLLADFRYAYRKNANLLGRVRAIAEGTGAADMIQDLSDISVLGKANTAELEEIKFDLTKLDVVEQRADELAELLAKANGVLLENASAKDIRDRAFTHLKEAVDEVRDCGKYVFRKDPNRYKGYISRYKK